MSREKLLQIIKRAINDSDFANKLYSNPEEALKSFNLNPNEVELLKSIQRDSFEKFTYELEDRLNKDDDWWIGSLRD